MQSQVRRMVAETLVAALGLALLAGAALAGRDWFERHFLPEFFQPRDEQLRWLTVVRVIAAGLGLLLVWPVRRAIGRWAGRRPARELVLDVAPTLVAVVLALGVSEVLLRHLPWFATHQLPTQREPLRRRDPVTGWAYAENRVGYGARGGGRVVRYAFDAAGHRVAAPGARVDYAAPSVLFVGESIISGHGVTYAESIPARVGRRLGLQPADLAVGGFATDQMYLRFAAEWPRYRKPRAVVILFMPALFHRNLEHDRPHLAPGLVWRPASDDWRLLQIAHRLAPYRSDEDLADAELMTRQALGRMTAMARARGATPVILVPELQPETREQAILRQRILAGLPVLRVPVDPAFHVARNRHPDARADAVMAEAIADWFAAHGLARSAPDVPHPGHTR